ncbi:MAG: glycosyltransferase family 39 protein [Sphingomonas bacterium]|nr:glycosyltransferase family 39 protein [Sphingomonas bacterium]
MRLFASFLASDVWHRGDPGNYLMLAQALNGGQGLALPGPDASAWIPTASFPPVLPLLMAGVGSLVPLTAVTLCIVNSLFDVAAALLLGRLSTQLGRPDLAVPLGLAYLVWPSIALMAPLAYKDGLAIALLLASLVALIEQARRGGFRWGVGSGLAAGALILTQPAIAPLLPLAFVALAPCFDRRSRWFRTCLIAAAAAVLVMLPWWVRNAITFGQFIPFTSSSGLALWQGAHPAGGIQYHPPPPEWARAGEFAGEKMARSAAWDVITADPLGYVQRCLAKFPKIFFLANWAIDQLIFAKGQPWPELVRSYWIRMGPTLAESMVAILAMMGLVILPKSLAARLLWASLAQIFLFGIWFEFSERHRLFMTPFVLLMVATLLTREQQRPPSLDRP